MSKSPSTSAGARPAATVIVLRDGPAGPEVFMVRRGETAAFMGGAYVFPGGRVDDDDRMLADARWSDGAGDALARLSDLGSREAAAYQAAALRELFEEAGILLARDRTSRFVSLADPGAHERFKGYRGQVHSKTESLSSIVEREGLRLALDALVPFAHWVTPAVESRRFDTRFFVTRVPPAQTPAHDATETIESAWLTAADAIARCVRDEIALPVPTWTTLREIEPFESADEVLDWARRRPIQRREPLFHEQAGEQMLLLPGDPLNPEPSFEPVPRETRFVLRRGRWRAGAPRT